MPARTLDPLDFLDVAAQFTPEQRQVRDSPSRASWTRACCRRSANASSSTASPATWCPKWPRSGIFGAPLEGYGCAGLDAVSYGLINQELERGDSALRSFSSVQTSLCMFPIHAFGSEAQKQRWLPAMARGEVIGCFGLTESQGGSDPANIRTHARRSGGDWLLSGSKMWITNGTIADLAVIWAQTDEGIRGFLVERGMQGLRVHRDREQVQPARFGHRRRCSSTKYACPDAQVLPGALGLKGPLSCLTQARYGICWGVIGAAQACLAELLDYTASRELFGRPLAANQAIQLRLADMSRRISTAQLLALQLARLKDDGRLRSRRRSRWPSGTTAGWRSTSPATAATCSAAPASAPSTSPCATC